MIQLPSTESRHVSEHNISIRPVTLKQGAEEAQSTSQVQQKIKTAEKIRGIFFHGRNLHPSRDPSPQ